MQFNRTLWRQQISARLETLARNPQQDMIISGSPNLFSHLCAITLRPLLDAFAKEPITAVQVLATLANGAGANQIIRRAAHLRYRASRALAREIRSVPELRHDMEHILVGLDVVQLAYQRMQGSTATWFLATLQAELAHYPMHEFTVLRRHLVDYNRSFIDIFREMRRRKGAYTPEDLILLFMGLKNSAPRVRAEAARCLGEYAWQPPDNMVNWLTQVAVYDRDLEARNAAARALGNLREYITTPTRLDELREYLHGNDRMVRSSTALLLAELGEQAASHAIIDRLTTLLGNDDDHYVREAAACALGRMGTPATADPVLRALTNALKDVDPNVHGAALDALTILRDLRAERSDVLPPPHSHSDSSTPNAHAATLRDDLSQTEPLSGLLASAS